MSNVSTEQGSNAADWVANTLPPFEGHLSYTRTMVSMWVLENPHVLTTMRCVVNARNKKFTSPVGLPWEFAVTALFPDTVSPHRT